MTVAEGANIGVLQRETLRRLDSLKSNIFKCCDSGIAINVELCAHGGRCCSKIDRYMPPSGVLMQYFSLLIYQFSTQDREAS